MAFLLFFFSAFIAWNLWNVAIFVANYRAARRIGLPIVTSPFNPFNPLWQLSSQRLVPLLKRLPFGLGNFTRYNCIGWSFEDKYFLHQEVGDAFVHVSPGENEVWVANAAAANDILSRSKDFPKSLEMYRCALALWPEAFLTCKWVDVIAYYFEEPLEIFGPNVDTVERKDWQRHRKLTTRALNERNNRLVWDEAVRQSRDMLRSWHNHDLRGTRNTYDDTTTLALHVLTSAGFGISYPFEGGLRTVQEGHTMLYGEALSAILSNIILVFALPHKMLASPYVPSGLNYVSRAVKEFRNYLLEMAKKERDLAMNGESGADNFMSSLIRASEEDKATTKSGSSKNGLSDDEVLGNLFIYNFAGHATSANTLAFAILLLAAFPEQQDWIREEIEHVVGEPEDLKYETVFPRLKRCLAVMHETLRLYGAVSAIPKYTWIHPQPLSINGRTYDIPPHTAIWLNNQALQTNPKYWGADSTRWRPDRWTWSASAKDDTGPETLREPTNGSFIPWSDGPRVCPGKKFSQVEFVAVMAVLFRQYKVKPALLEGESEDGAKQRVLATVDDSLTNLTLQMRQPKNVALVWTRCG